MYSVGIDYIVNESNERRIQFYIYKTGQEDWSDVISAEDLEEGFEWAKKWIQNDLIVG